MPHNSFDTLKTFQPAAGKTGQYYSLPALAATFPNVKRLPVSIRVVLESVLRNVRRQENHRGAREGAGGLGAEGGAHRGGSLRPRAHPAAGLHRGAAAGGPRRHAQRGRAHRQEPEGDRAAGAGGPGGRPLGADRLFRRAQRARPQHEARVLAQPRALPVHEMGHAGLRHLQGRPARHRHRAPGEPRVPRARRIPQGRRLLPRHARGHRQPHHHGQRHRRGGLGRGRDRGRGRHARPAGLHARPGRGGREPQRQGARGRDRHRRRAHRDRDAAQGEGGGQVRRVLRRGHGLARGARSRDDREHGAGIRRDHGLLPDRRQDHRLFPRARAAPPRPFPPSRPTSRRRGSSACRRRATSTTARPSSSTWAASRPRWPDPSARRTASSWAG